MDLPENWGLTTVKRDDGKLDVLGKADNGESYRVRTTDHAEITETDIQELKAADRESYSNRESGARQFCRSLAGDGESKRAREESLFLDDITEAAGPVVRAGFGQERAVVGTSRRYRQNYDSVFGGN